jgi:hypothetical protein
MEGNYSIDKVVSALSQIELDAIKIEEETEVIKNEYSAYIDKKIKDFDKEIQKEHKENLLKLSKELEEEKEEELSAMKEETELIINHFQKAYDKKHSIWAKEIFEELIRS